MGGDKDVPIRKLEGSLLSPYILFAFLVNGLDLSLTGRQETAVEGGREGCPDIVPANETYKRTSIAGIWWAFLGTSLTLLRGLSLRTATGRHGFWFTLYIPFRGNIPSPG
jgi:hypothetical protein